jgi:hypothetical protein
MDSARTDAALAWVTKRVLNSDLMPHYFDLREKGMAADIGADAVREMAFNFLVSRCAFFATVVAKKLGREHAVSFFDETGVLLHSVVACSPQYDSRFLTGNYVDAMGRGRLKDMQADLEDAFGPTTVKIGELVSDEDFSPNEESTLAELAGVLPWTRNFMGEPLARERDPEVFILCVKAACSDLTSSRPQP